MGGKVHSVWSARSVRAVHGIVAHRSWSRRVLTTASVFLDRSLTGPPYKGMVAAELMEHQLVFHDIRCINFDQAEWGAGAVAIALAMYTRVEHATTPVTPYSPLTYNVR